jgi:hypothetical protein
MKFKLLSLGVVAILSLGLFGCGSDDGAVGKSLSLGEGHEFVVEEVHKIEKILGENFDPGIDGLLFDYEGEELVLAPEELMFEGLVSDKGVVEMLALSGYLKERGMILTVSDLRRMELARVRGESTFNGEKLFRGHRVVEDLNEALLLASVKAAGDYLTSAVDEEGRFVYEYDPVKDEVAESYNILRHGGTTYSMLELFRMTGDERLLASAGRALNYLVSVTEDCGFGALCVVENGTVKVGGNALAILAFVEYGRAMVDLGYEEEADSYLKEAQGLARWIASVQQEDGSFKPHKYDLRAAKASDFVSEYYPGEAIFALSRLAEFDGDEQWLDVAEANALYLINDRDAGKEVAQLIHDHWLLYGLNELYRARPREEFLVHTERTVRAILDSQHKEADLVEDKQDWQGGYYVPPRSTPTATRSEGLVAAYKLLRDYEDLLAVEDRYVELEEIMLAIEEGLRFQLATQYGEEALLFFGDEVGARVIGGFHESLTDFGVRIDFVQHNLSAILGYGELG